MLRWNSPDRFSLVTVKLGGKSQEIIVDNHSHKTLDSDYGSIKTSSGFVRHVGRTVVGYFASNLVTAGKPDDVVFLGVFYFDGDWRYTDKNVQSNSGTGRLHKALEKYWQSQH